MKLSTNYFGTNVFPFFQLLFINVKEILYARKRYRETETFHVRMACDGVLVAYLQILNRIGTNENNSRH